MRKIVVPAMAVAMWIGVCSTVTPAHAVLSPYWQRVTEMQAIAGHAAVAEKLEARGPIEAIEAVGPDAYVVKAGGCTLEVAITDAPPNGEPMPGPRQFDVRVGALSCP
ncbi:hypothetical protein RUR49_08365 [Pseudoxanthobacter sp. M-2]|uniref:hypothetical protein n=1 Tax=Pseudoxanthobacter sp. M-2 TaxID=3078754 RepID=UPI0038FC189B